MNTFNDGVALLISNEVVKQQVGGALTGNSGEPILGEDAVAVLAEAGLDLSDPPPDWVDYPAGLCIYHPEEPEPYIALIALARGCRVCVVLPFIGKICFRVC